MCKASDIKKSPTQHVINQKNNVTKYNMLLKGVKNEKLVIKSNYHCLSLLVQNYLQRYETEKLQ